MLKYENKLILISLIILIISMIMISGCITKYKCPDGKIVNNPNGCKALVITSNVIKDVSTTTLETTTTESSITTTTEEKTTTTSGSTTTVATTSSTTSTTTTSTTSKTKFEAKPLFVFIRPLYQFSVQYSLSKKNHISMALFRCAT